MSETSTPSNRAAVLGAAYADLEVRQVEYRHPGPGELVIRNRAVAINPLDAVKQGTGNMMYGWLPYPTVLGEDVAGEVVEIGSGVTRFTVGDRVFAYAVGMEKGRDPIAEGGFQQYTVVRELLAAPIPASMSFEQAAVLPLAVSTAASALFQRDQLGLRFPTAGDGRTGQTVVVWGGSTSVGNNAIQLAAAAGYDVVTTASPHNHDRMRRLGATAVFDYASPTAVRDLVAALAGKPVAGVFAIGTGSAEPSLAIAIATRAKRVALASPSVSLGRIPRSPGLNGEFIRVIAALVGRTTALQVRSRLRGIRTRFVWGSTLMTNEVGPMLWGQFLPSALADGRFVSAPAAEVVGSTLGDVQGAIDLLRKGVSAKKLVVTL
jgi:NADPH:quinone reductase-like Zn-dependent oxidoreductase